MTQLLYIANIRVPTEKAHGIHIMKMCEAFSSLKRHPLEVELLVSSRENPTEGDPFAFYGIPNTFQVKKIWSPLWFQHSASRIGFYLQAFFFACGALYYVYRNTPEMVYTRDLFTGYMLSLFGFSFGFELHTTNSPDIFIRRVVKKTQPLAVISQGLKDFLIKKHGAEQDRILVLPDAVDLREFDTPLDRNGLREEYGLPEDKQIITYVGKYKTMGQPKGVKEFIEAFAKVAKANAAAFLLLVGLNQDELSEVGEFIRSLGIPDGAYKLVGHIAHKDALLHMKGSDVLVMNYPNTPHYANYMSPLKLFEYMGSRIPIIATDLPVIREVLDQHAAFLVAPDNQQALVDGMSVLLSDPQLGKSLARGAFEKVQHYSWNARALRILEELLRGKASRDESHPK